MASSKIPDARWINRELDISKVARALGVQVSGNRLHCWHNDRHRHGDADPSVAVWREQNRLKCFVCEQAAMSVIDLVMDYHASNFKEAVRWLSCNFAVPLTAAGKPSEFKTRHLQGITDPMAYLVRSHIFSFLSVPTRLIAPVMLSFCDRRGQTADSPRELTISYRALMRYSGLTSPNAVRKAIEELTVIGWLRAESKRTGVLRATGSYLILPFSQAVQDFGEALAKGERQFIEYERGQAKERRIERERAFRERKKVQNGAQNEEIAIPRIA